MGNGYNTITLYNLHGNYYILKIKMIIHIYIYTLYIIKCAQVK